MANHSESESSSRRLVLLGKTGVGKSASGNTILGERRFRSEFGFSSVTTKCEMQHADVAGRTVYVVDTPGLCDTNISSEKYADEIGSSIYLSSPGPHAFLYVLPINTRFTEQEEQVVQKCESMFGQGMRKYTIILFTHGDLLKGKGMNIKGNMVLSRIVEQCGGRYHVFNNEDQSNREQVKELMEKIEKLVKQNGGSYYSNIMYKDAACFRKMQEDRIRKEEEDRKMREKGKIMDEMEKQGEDQRQEEEKRRRREEQQKNEEIKTRIRMEMIHGFKKKQRRNLRIVGFFAAGVEVGVGTLIGAIAGGCVGGPIGAGIGAAVGTFIGGTAAAGGIGVYSRHRGRAACEKGHQHDAADSGDREDTFSPEENTSENLPLLEESSVRHRGNREHR